MYLFGYFKKNGIGFMDQYPKPKCHNWKDTWYWSIMNIPSFLLHHFMFMSLTPSPLVTGWSNVCYGRGLFSSPHLYSHDGQLVHDEEDFTECFFVCLFVTSTTTASL